MSGSSSLLLYEIYLKGSQTFSETGQIVNILGHTVTITTTQFCHFSTKVNKWCVNEGAFA
jgi:hypothetical protein